MTEEEFLFVYMSKDYSNCYLKELAPYFRNHGILVKRHEYSERSVKLWEFTEDVKTKASYYHIGDTVSMETLLK